MTKRKRARLARARRSPRSPRDAQPETEQKILDAARRVFVRRGTAGARMQEIAAEAGVNQALLHYYYRSKERLSAAVFAQFASRLIPTVVGILGSDASLDDKVDRVVAAYLKNLSQNPFLPGYVLSEMHHHPERVQQLVGSLAGGEPSRMMSPVFTQLQQQIDERVAAGAMRPISAHQFTVNLLSLCVFPFAARPMLGIMLGFNDASFARFIEQRRTELPAFFRNALRP